MVVPRWRMLPVPFLVINDVIMTSLLLLKIVLANFSTPYFLSVFLFLSILREICILTTNSTI